MMLEHFSMHEEAASVRNAVEWTLQNGFVTKDIDPVNFYFTSTIGELVCDHIAQRIPGEVNQANIEIRKSTII
jgi:3-isopropylmalate dehydrogenase